MYLIAALLFRMIVDVLYNRMTGIQMLLNLIELSHAYAQLCRVQLECDAVLHMKAMAVVIDDFKVLGSPQALES